MLIPRLRLAAALAAALLLVACGRSGDALVPPVVQDIPAADRAAALIALYDEYWEENLALNPVLATFIGDGRYNAKLPDLGSAAHRDAVHAFMEKWLARAESISTAGLEGQDLLNHQIFVRRLRSGIEARRYPDWMMPVNQMGGIHTFMAQLGSGAGAQPFKTVEDYDNWLARAGRVPAIIDTHIANMRQGIAAGVVQPRPLMEKVLPQLDALITDTPEQSVFWGPIERLPEEFSDAEKARLDDAYRELITGQLMPAYGRLRTFIADVYLPATRDSVGLDKLPQGKAWYDFAVRESTTTDLSPDQIHHVGLEEVARIQGEMRAVMADVGFDGSMAEFFEFMKNDPQFVFPSEEALLEFYRAIGTRVDARIHEKYSLVPRATYEIRPVEPFRARSMAGGQYFPPSDDGSRPGIFYVNTYDLPTRKAWEAESLFLHEAVPGHHFQIALQIELAGMPAFRRWGGENSFAEGWGLYAESQGKALGLYTDPYQYFGRLQLELWRAIRLVVDTGLHSKDWTREQVISYMLENSATSEVNAIAEAERYIAWPAQALAYKIGELKILELRSLAEQELGERFDVREFHAEVLKDGAVPLDVLEAKIRRWIARSKP
jgi:uncharacterized protein (DUF885 family)